MYRTIAVALLLLFLPASLLSENVKPTERTHGCLFKFCTYAGGASFLYFIKVADDEYDSSEGEPQIWGFDPNDKHYDKKGKLIFVSVLEKDFIRAGMVHIDQGCICHCPIW